MRDFEVTRAPLAPTIINSKPVVLLFCHQAQKSRLLYPLHLRHRSGRSRYPSVSDPTASHLLVVGSYMEPNNWDLQAVVSGCCFTGPTATASVDPFSSFPPPMPGQQEEELIRVSFPDLLETTGSSLYELCKPFFLNTLHHRHQQQPQPQTEQHHQHHLSSATHQPQQLRHSQRPQTQISRSKRRKNQQKKVVCQVPADGASPDLWAWRKYGQKPIKGSPFPRGYYRCSSSKGCPARKQVERSRTDPGTLVITYTAEHNHPIPTHRSSLAGSTRQKFSPIISSAKPPAAPGSDNPPELLQRRRRRPEHGEEGGEAVEEDEDDDEDELLMVEDMEMLGEDGILFVDLAEPGESGTHAAASPGDAVSAASAFDGAYGEHFYLPPWLASNNTAAAAGGS